MMIFLGLLLSYFMGSIPTAYLLVKIIKKEDIRKLGSGNVGATNASRIVGKKWGVFILTIDMLKAFIPAVFIADYILRKSPFVSSELLRVILGISAVIGHNWPIFLGFKGGKGVASTFGILLGLALKVNGFWAVLVSSLILWSIILLVFRMVSLASISSAILLPFFMLIFGQKREFIIAGFIFSVFILWRHLPNIRRILQGKEPRI